MRKVYCDKLIKRLANYVMSVSFYAIHEYTSHEECCEEIEKIMEEFENGKSETEDKTLRKCQQCRCEFNVAYSGNIDGKKYCSERCRDADKEES